MPNYKELGLSRDMIRAVSAIYDKVIANYREADRTFVERGFATVATSPHCDAVLFDRVCSTRFMQYCS